MSKPQAGCGISLSCKHVLKPYFYNNFTFEGIRFRKQTPVYTLVFTVSNHTKKSCNYNIQGFCELYTTLLRNAI